MKFTAFPFLLVVPLVAGLVGWLVVWFRDSKPSNGQAELTFAQNCGDKDDLHPCYCEQGLTSDYVVTDILVCRGLDNERQLLSPLATTLRHYHEVTVFRLESSTFRYLPSELFKGQKFKRIVISGSTLSALTDSDLAFVGLELQFLNLTDTPLHTEWDWTIFGNLSALNRLDVVGGNVDTLDRAPEDSRLSPDNVAFEKSGISFLHPEVLQNFGDLFFVSFSGNFIQDVRRTMLPSPASKLQHLDFSFNKIEDLPTDMFTGMPSLAHINIAGNKILTLNEKTFRPVWGHIITLTAYANDVECDCRLLWTLARVFSVNAICWEPLELRGRTVRSLKPEELWC